MANTTWQLDPAHSEVSFKVRHLVISNVTGKFSSFDSSFSTGADDFNDANINFTIDANTINTGVDARDNHLRSDDFFNTEAFPKITFKGNGLKKTDDGKYELTGELTIRDVTQPITLDVEFGGVTKDPYGNIKAGFEVEGKIKRKSFGLTWDAVTEAGGAVVSDEIKFTAQVQYIKG
jgi:polyisoprenoid-binding protein YceI